MSGLQLAAPSISFLSPSLTRSLSLSHTHILFPSCSCETGSDEKVTSQPPKFHLADENIYVRAAGSQRRGPYKIDRVDTISTPVRYSLATSDGTLVDNGAMFDETRLEQI